MVQLRTTYEAEREKKSFFFGINKFNNNCNEVNIHIVAVSRQNERFRQNKNERNVHSHHRQVNE